MESTHGNAAVPLPPYPFAPEGAGTFPQEPDALGSVGSLDFNRHGKRAIGNKQDDPSMNMLYADGHADTVSYRQAVKALMKY
jgi:prepilin-type processing-associated H-X9-DG protein